MPPPSRNCNCNCNCWLLAAIAGATNAIVGTANYGWFLCNVTVPQRCFRHAHNGVIPPSSSRVTPVAVNLLKLAAVTSVRSTPAQLGSQTGDFEAKCDAMPRSRRLSGTSAWPTFTATAVAVLWGAANKLLRCGASHMCAWGFENLAVADDHRCQPRLVSAAHNAPLPAMVSTIPTPLRELCKACM